jgi:hypothetical protein
MIIRRREKALNDVVEILWLMVTSEVKNMTAAQRQRHKQKLKHAIKMVLLAWR